MRRVSAARKQRLAEVSQWREDFCNTVGRCEFCLVAASPQALDIHELCVGSCRKLALDAPYCVLAAHRHCHSILEMLTIPNQLAYLLRAAPERFDLEAYWKLCQRRWPDLDTILAFKEKL
jgi:hypothetical protein